VALAARGDISPHAVTCLAGSSKPVIWVRFPNDALKGGSGDILGLSARDIWDQVIDTNFDTNASGK
jgi:hypothetical protein